MIRYMNLGEDNREDQALVDHLMGTVGLSAGTARRIIDDVLAHHAETIEEYVIRRHRQLSASGIRNPAAFQRIQDEVARRPFKAGVCTLRQIRRIIYG
jgi:hypothetical protein